MLKDGWLQNSMDGHVCCTECTNLIFVNSKWIWNCCSVLIEDNCNYSLGALSDIFGSCQWPPSKAILQKNNYHLQCLMSSLRRPNQFLYFIQKFVWELCVTSLGALSDLKLICWVWKVMLLGPLSDVFGPGYFLGC